ncbi:MAG: hypothetical protein Q7T50_04530, partial [Candidatus Magasanikbacteria bacterium]|nr:hypothetical protein [Candidatus Magasanikbacteria bacterium]
ELKRQIKKIKIKKQQRSDIISLSAQDDWFRTAKKYLQDFLALPAQIISVFLLLFLGLTIFNSTQEPKNETTIFLSDNLKPEIINYALADVNTPEQIQDEKTLKLKNEINAIVKDAPMKAMVDRIVQKDKTVAAFLVGIAMKESKFGTYSPKKDGADCYNYWGYRGKENPTKSGYSCFDTPEQAVDIVGKRIENIIKQGAKTPADMVIWKCGYSCAAFSDESVNKWIADVGINYYRLNPREEIAKKNKK